MIRDHDSVQMSGMNNLPTLHIWLYVYILCKMYAHLKKVASLSKKLIKPSFGSLITGLLAL